MDRFVIKGKHCIALLVGLLMVLPHPYAVASNSDVSDKLFTDMLHTQLTLRRTSQKIKPSRKIGPIIAMTTGGAVIGSASIILTIAGTSGNNDLLAMGVIFGVAGIISLGVGLKLFVDIQTQHQPHKQHIAQLKKRWFHLSDTWRAKRHKTISHTQKKLLSIQTQIDQITERKKQLPYTIPVTLLVGGGVGVLFGISSVVVGGYTALSRGTRSLEWFIGGGILVAAGSVSLIIGMIQTKIVNKRKKRLHAHIEKLERKWQHSLKKWKRTHSFNSPKTNPTKQSKPLISLSM
ncbi:MAG TPA: hypothetical protein DCE42_09955 [Myxococcales bacterium]|nr:hypothetical protein [Deltaproteobacteria bacterium]HAA55072.1 hypothetical protein [Myxococcales bacterium]